MGIDSETYGPYTSSQIVEMLERGQILRTDHAHAVGGSVWVKIEDDPVLSPLVRTHKTTIPAIEPPVRVRRKRRWSGRIIGVLSILAVAWITWPYYAAFSLFVALRDGDVPVLEKRVNWNDVRQGLRGDLNAMLLKNIRTSKSNDSSDTMASGLAAVLGPAVVNQMVDGYVTPQALASISRDNNLAKSERETAGSVSNLNNSMRQARHIRWNQVQYAFFHGSPFTFTIEVLPENDPPLKNPVTLEFNWVGDWKLTRVLLPSDVFRSASDSARGANDKTELDTPSPKPDLKVATSEPTATASLESDPIALTLTSKRFKEANIKASDFQAAILFELSIKNLTDKNIRAFDGVLTFTDLLDNEILSTKLAINDAIDTGSSEVWSGSINYNQFIDTHQRLRNENQANLKIKFSARKVLFADGSSKQFGGK